jgi:hypothetical protein
LVGSEESEMKRTKIFVWACETHAKRISFRFISLWSENFFEAKPAHPKFSCRDTEQMFVKDQWTIKHEKKCHNLKGPSHKISFVLRSHG